MVITKPQTMKLPKTKRRALSLAITSLVPLSGCFLLISQNTNLHEVAFKSFVVSLILEALWLGYLIVADDF